MPYFLPLTMPFEAPSYVEVYKGDIMHGDVLSQ